MTQLLLLDISTKFKQATSRLSCSLEKGRAKLAAHLGLRGHILTLDCHTLLNGLTCYATSNFPLPHPALQNGATEMPMWKSRGGCAKAHPDSWMSDGQWARLQCSLGLVWTGLQCSLGLGWTGLRCSLGLSPEAQSSHEPFNLPST